MERMKLTKIEAMGLEWYIFLKKPVEEMKAYLNRCKLIRIKEKSRMLLSKLA